MTDLAAHIQSTLLVDTHEHLVSEAEFIESGPDVLHDLFSFYIGGDLITAGAPYDNVVRLLDSSDPDVAGRWQGVSDYWPFCQHTGWGQAVRIMAKTVYGMEDLTLETIEAAAPINARIRQPGGRKKLLQEVGHIEQVQIDNFMWDCPTDPEDPAFFRYDLSWADFCRGEFNLETLYEHTGVEVIDLPTLRQAMEGLFQKHGRDAIAIKAQLPYYRTMIWVERSDSEAEAALQTILRGDNINEADRLCLGDWSWAQGLELSIEHGLPFKLHTGYLAGNDYDMEHTRIRPSSFSRLLMRYPEARVVLMHIAYPYTDELIAVAKHYKNCIIDMCWGWSINPPHAMDFLRRALHGIPYNRIFAFGGDAFYPAASVAYAIQARQWLSRALQAEVDDGFLTEPQAMHIASRLMRENQLDVFEGIQAEEPLR